MFCSISTRKSNLKWLDRLRSSKGFSGPGDDSDQFLANQNEPTNISSKQTDPEAQFTSTPSQNPERAPFLGDVLAELFAFGPDPPNIPSKKNPRKIPNPKSCKVNSVSVCDLRVLERCDKNGDDRVGGGEEVGVSKNGVLGEEEENVDWDLSGFSRTEVAVIDTSFEGWKFEKVLFRKKSVWEVRDRKSKGVGFENNDEKKMKMKMKKKKKRKLSVEEEGGVGVCKKKKRNGLGQCSSSKEGKRGDLSMRINDEAIRKGKLICYT